MDIIEMIYTVLSLLWKLSEASSSIISSCSKWPNFFVSSVAGILSLPSGCFLSLHLFPVCIFSTHTYSNGFNQQRYASVPKTLVFKPWSLICACLQVLPACSICATKWIALSSNSNDPWLISNYFSSIRVITLLVTLLFFLIPYCQSITIFFL
jgi:uncharacterized membrane protein YkvI